MFKVLVVEDETNLAEGLKFNLELEGYSCDVLMNAEEALKTYSDYDMMVLDIMLPGMSGLELLNEIRAKDYQFPVLILSARSSEENFLEGLAAGADDYIAKPFSLPELMLRIRRILERQVWYTEKTAEEESCSFGKYWIDFASFQAQTNDGVLGLTQHECYVMKYLIENRSRAVSREELLEKVWGYSVTPETRTVDNFIARLRKHFEENTKSPRHIKSIRGVGYRFFS